MGSAGGLHHLIDAHYQPLYRYAYRLTGSAADAEDLTQETFGKALARLPQLRDPDRARAWLYRILRNAYLHRVRDQKRHRVVPLDAVGDLPERPGDELPDIDPDRLQQALNELDETFRTPIILYYFEDFSYRDIAEQMDLPIGTVMSRLARAKAYLRAQLGASDSDANPSFAQHRPTVVPRGTTTSRTESLTPVPLRPASNTILAGFGRRIRWMECRDAQFYLRLRRQAADELGAEVTVELDRHLSACSKCAADAQQLVTFDRVLGAAMRAVPVPAGLRDRLVTHVSAQQGSVLRRKVYRYASLAAAVLIAIGIGVQAFQAARPQPDPLELATNADTFADPQLAENAVRRWLVDQKLPGQLPERFDYNLLMSYGWESVKGREVPVVVFRDRVGSGFAKVYLFKDTRFDLKGLTGLHQSSHCTAVVYRTDAEPGLAIVIVHTGQDLRPFLRGTDGLAG